MKVRILHIYLFTVKSFLWK